MQPAQGDRPAAMKGDAAMTERAAQTKEVLSFGPFSLVASERSLTREGAPVVLGARALDILVVLLSRPNEIISKNDLLARVWPDVTVDEGCLRFHIAALRKALADGKDGARYIATLSGRGYCFVAPVLGSSEQAVAVAAARFSHASLPAPPIGMIGRDDDVLRLSARLTAARLVTIVGAGGIGKTTVAVAVGHHLTDAFAGAVLFVDLGMLNDPGLVVTAVASMLGLSVQSDDATPMLIACLRDKRILLILDTCEHLIEAAAALAFRIFTDALQVHILATSREALQVEGENVYRLDPLSCPPDDPGLTAAIARKFPATRLFVDRAVASGARLDFSDAEAAIVVGICRKLDGVALAIELAARRVGSYGLQQTAALLDQSQSLLWLGPRTAPPRQKTMQATLDWSYQLLSEAERLVLRRLAIFVGHFTLDTALEVVTSSTADQTVVLGAIDSLVAKSMIATHPIGAMMRYRLLDTTRAYVLELGIADPEFAELAVRYATCYRRRLEQTQTEWAILWTLEKLHMFHFRGGDFGVTRQYAQRCRALAATIEDHAATALACSNPGGSLHVMGDLGGTRAELEAWPQNRPPARQTSTIYGYDRPSRASIALARTLWLQGHPAQAVGYADQAIKGAARVGHPAPASLRSGNM